MIRDQIVIPVGYLWKKTGKDGQEFLAGTLNIGIFGEIPIVIFKEEKSNDKSPDHVIRLAKTNHESN